MMEIVGRVESLWRYPVKSMRGEELAEVFVSRSGVKGDRLFAFRSSAAPADFPYFTARQNPMMLRCIARVRPNEQLVEIETPAGEIFAIDDPRLRERLREGVDPKHELTLMQSERALTDTHTVSIISVQTVRQLAQESGIASEKRRFRANIYLDLSAGHEDDFVGYALRIGRELVVKIVKRDTRCIMINLHPDTLANSPALLKTVAQLHDGKAGIYGEVLREGTIRKGNAVELVRELPNE